MIPSAISHGQDKNHQNFWTSIGNYKVSGIVVKDSENSMTSVY